MSIESHFPSSETINAEKGERKIYPERASFAIEDSIEKLRKIKSGEIQTIELSEKERSEIVSFENEIGVEFEEIFDIKVNSTAIHPEYLLTGNGRAAFRACMNFDVEGGDIASMEKFICRSRGQINAVSGIQLKQLEGQSKKYSEDLLLAEISKTITDLGEINVDGIKTHQALSIVLNPEEALSKIEKLRNFKRKLKGLAVDASAENNSENYAEVRKSILDQYAKRINEVIVDQFGHVVKMKLLSGKIGEENLSAEEHALLEQFSGLNKFVAVYSRFDKFVFGTDGEANENGNYEQIGERMNGYAEDMEKRYIENERSKKQKAQEKGLDFSKLMKKNVSSSVFSQYAEAFLDRYEQKSSMPAEQFDPKRKGPAPDGKWQFVVSDSYNAMSVNLGPNIIKAPSRDRSVQELISILLGHEFTHFIQSLNQSKIKLKLYDKIGGDRRQTLAEGAAMSNQKQISEEIFGFSELPKPNYVKAMAEKISGGDYLDCVKAYYDCSMRIYGDFTGNISSEALKEKAEEMLGVSIRSCKRLFKSGEQLDAKTKSLSKSKDTVYLEQLMVMDRLKEAGLEKFALVRGLNLDSLFVLLKNGFIKEQDIETLDMDFIRRSWEDLKGGFLLEDTQQN